MRIGLQLVLVLACGCHAASSPDPEVARQKQSPQNGGPDARRVDFLHDVQPILANRCFTCHGPDKKKNKADVRLDVRESLLSLVVPGSAQQSKLMARVISPDPDTVMPPPHTAGRLDEAEIATIAQWINAGALYPRHWAFVPPVLPPLPTVSDESWPRNEIDYFVLNELEQHGLRPTRAANRTTLLRRMTLDVTGLPPTPGEVDSFVATPEEDAYETRIEQCFRSDRYGEHMAESWLHASRYADSHGYQNDEGRYMHAWRDWVILAFNANQPYDRFITEQIAGDLLPQATLTQQIATGFFRNHRINIEGGVIRKEWYVENIMERVDALGTVFLGLTLSCARCHSHKFDPISQDEFYQLFAYFNNVTEWGVGNANNPPFVSVPESWPHLSSDENRFVEPAPVKLQRNIDGAGLMVPQAGGPKTVMVMHERESRRPTFKLTNGRYDSADRSVELHPGVPAFLQLPPDEPPRDRLELARWLTDPRHPLTARVAVNRIWQHFFGVGLVKTSEDFGTQGEPPGHPQLLDWLALEFVRHDWDVQWIQTKILTSATYRQASTFDAATTQQDPENRLLSRGPRQRLSAFSLRDQALFVSGLLVEQLGGPPVNPYMPPKLWQGFTRATYQQHHGDNLYRRSVYTFWRRTTPPPTMVEFNAPDRETCSVRIDPSNTPQQALALMNNVTFVEASRFLAERMIRAGGDSPAEQLAFGFRLATCRQPRPHELAVLVDAHRAFQDQFENQDERCRLLLTVGEKPRDERIDLHRHAAMTMAASLVLNLDETITKD